MDRLISVLIESMLGYVKPGLNGGNAYFTRDDEHLVYAAIDIGAYPPGNKYYVNAYLVAHIADGYIVIDRDMNDKMLVDALIQNGIPREQIVLAYAGEHIPEKQIPTLT